MPDFVVIILVVVSLVASIASLVISIKDHRTISRVIQVQRSGGRYH